MYQRSNSAKSLSKGCATVLRYISFKEEVEEFFNSDGISSLDRNNILNTFKKSLILYLTVKKKKD